MHRATFSDEGRGSDGRPADLAYGVRGIAKALEVLRQQHLVERQTVFFVVGYDGRLQAVANVVACGVSASPSR